MENGNPKAVIEAVTAPATKAGAAVLGDITIFKYALMEKLRSPFLFGDEEFSVENVVPTLFVLASGKELLKGLAGDPAALKAAALDWADENLGVEDLAGAVKAVVDKLAVLNRAAPSGSKKN